MAAYFEGGNGHGAAAATVMNLFQKSQICVRDSTYDNLAV